MTPFRVTFFEDSFFHQGLVTPLQIGQKNILRPLNASAVELWVAGPWRKLSNLVVAGYRNRRGSCLFMTGSRWQLEKTSKFEKLDTNTSRIGRSTNIIEHSDIGSTLVKVRIEHGETLAEPSGNMI
ncbi:6515_t:CDS:2 [Acaulospora morrowiae]|uniref:6515_t:CDS:1 n=1 Tax=Acaulospora morrowiae TaxID=94023 RepID=A0A9N8Z8Z6_9GLOM|nr:6515_t:CDS:2 [Acaulospora morrowiae]